MNVLIRFVHGLASKRRITALLMLAGAVFGAIVVTLVQLAEASGGYGILDFEQGYSVARVREVLGSYGPEGMALYQRIQMLDLLNPALYSLVAAVLTSALWRGRGPDWLCLMPLLAGAGDYAENVTLFLLVRGYPEVPEGLVAISSTLNLLKYGCLILGMLPLGAGLALMAVRRARV